MLNPTRLRRLVGIFVAVVAGVAGSIVSVITVAAPATADECWQWVEISPGKTVYVNTCDGDGDGEDPPPDGGGGEEQQCYQGRLEAMDYDDAWCDGDLSCYIYVPPPGDEDPADWPPRPPGTSDTAVYGRYSCFTQPPEERLVISMRDDWVEIPEPVDWLAEAQTAIGQILLPDFDLAFSPETRTYVAVDTAFWADGASASALTGSSALGLVAIATPDRFELNPGDGTGVKTCEFSVTEGSGCTHTFDDASVDGGTTANGEPAYAAEARLVYTISFEFAGAPFTIPGAPAELPTEWETTGVPVGEVQVIID